MVARVAQMTKTAIVTGGSTGIGAELVRTLVKAGYRVAFTYRSSKDEAEAVATKLDGKAKAYRCDNGDEADLDAFYTAIDTDFGAPDLLVNNAGMQVWAPLLDLETKDWDSVIQTNLRGCFLNTQRAARLMVRDGIKGSIVNIGSGCNKLAFPNLVSYTASKGGIEQFTKVSAAELGPHGIRVNCVAPGAIEIERTKDEQDDYAGQWSPLTPLRRVGKPADIAGPVMFLASDQAGFVTGQTIWVDGGLFSQAPWPQ